MTRRIQKDQLPEPKLSMAPAPVDNQFGVEASREVAEAQASILMAKMYPRDMDVAFANIMKSCQRPALAQNAIYRYPRGGKMVEGPSIRLAEALAQCWGNMTMGIKELSRNGGSSTMMAFAKDWESNTSKTQVFEVRHWRDKQNGGTELTSERDIYEIAANMGHRRLRACILAVIPGDIVDAAVDKCNSTLARVRSNTWSGPVEDRARQMVAAFSTLGVTKEMLVKHQAHPLEQSKDEDFTDLQKLFVAIRDGQTSASEVFKTEPEGEVPA